MTRGGSRNSGWGGVDFYFKGMGFRGRLKAPGGSRAISRWGPRQSPGKLLNFSDFGSKLALIGEVIPSLKRRNVPLSTLL